MRLSQSDLTSGVTTLNEMLRWRAITQPNFHGYTFLIDGETTEVSLTYAELDRRAQVIAAELRRADAIGERVLLLFPFGLDFIVAFFGCLYAGAVAVPAYPPAAHKPVPRLQVIAADAQAKVALTTCAVETKLALMVSDWPELAKLRVIAVDALPAGAEGHWQNPGVAGDTLALLQYTSGSTGTPRGVMVTHSNLLDNLELTQNCVNTSPATPGVCWLPMFHDMGLLSGVLQPLYAGTNVTLMSPIAFLQRPSRWLQALSRVRAVITGAPAFALDLCVRRISPEQRATLDLSSLDVLYVSAEPVRPETLDRFSAYFAPCGFRRTALYPCYGLAEATVLAAGGDRDALPVVKRFSATGLTLNRALPAAENENTTRSLVGCGRERGNHVIAIVDPMTGKRCAEEHIGEIWVAGPHVAQGYWNRPDETEQVFHAYVADTGEGPFARTGDLGFLDAGELFITGRLKDIIIIYGTNHSPQEIETTVERSHPALRQGCSAAFTIEVTGEERLVMVQEVERGYRLENIEDVFGAIRQGVAEEHGLQTYAIVLIRPGSIPKTTSGKVQRFACRERYLAGTLEALASRQMRSIPSGATELL